VRGGEGVKRWDVRVQLKCPAKSDLLVLGAIHAYTHLAVILPTKARAPSRLASCTYCIHSPTSALNFFSARSKIWNCLRTRAYSETDEGEGGSSVGWSKKVIDMYHDALSRFTRFLRSCSSPISYAA
jgi:hypothetical protein